MDILFALVLEFCSPVVCEEYVIDSKITQQECANAQQLANALYAPIPTRVLYTHYADKYGAEYMDGYKDIDYKNLSCKIEY